MEGCRVKNVDGVVSDEQGSQLWIAAPAKRIYPPCEFLVTAAKQSRNSFSDEKNKTN